MSRVHIRANQPWWRLDGRELWEYRDLLWFLVKRDFTAVYKQTILGPAWFFLEPLATTIVFTVIFGTVAKIGTDGMPPLLFYLGGLMFWTYFAACLNGVANVVFHNTNLFAKVYVPRLILPLSLVASQFGRFACSLLLFLGFYLYFLGRPAAVIHPTAWLAAVPLLVFLTAATGLGVGLWLCALTAKYRDLRFALPFLSQLWLYLTPIPYPASLLPPKWLWLLSFNPMAGVVEFGRYAFLGAGTPSLPLLAASTVSALLLLVSGLLVFHRAQRTLVDTL